MEMDSFLKDFKIDPFHNFTTVGEYVANLKTNVANIYKKLDEQLAKDPEFESSPEYLVSTMGAQAISDEIKFYEQLNPSLHLNQIFD